MIMKHMSSVPIMRAHWQAMPGEQEMAEPSDDLPDEGAQLQGQQSDDKLQPAEEQIHKILPHA